MRIANFLNEYLVLFSNIISLESYKINYFLINDLGLIYKIQQRLKLI